MPRLNIEITDEQNEILRDFWEMKLTEPDMKLFYVEYVFGGWRINQVEDELDCAFYAKKAFDIRLTNFVKAKNISEVREHIRTIQNVE